MFFFLHVSRSLNMSPSMNLSLALCFLLCRGADVVICPVASCEVFSFIVFFFFFLNFCPHASLWVSLLHLLFVFHKLGVLFFLQIIINVYIYILRIEHYIPQTSVLQRFRIIKHRGQLLIANTIYERLISSIYKSQLLFPAV